MIAEDARCVGVIVPDEVTRFFVFFTGVSLFSRGFSALSGCAASADVARLRPRFLGVSRSADSDS